MSIKKYIATEDNSITNGFYGYSKRPAIYANNGAADSLEIFSIFHPGSQSEKSRILLNFPLDKIKQDREKGIIANPGNTKFYLKLYNVEHTETLPVRFYSSILPISSSWEEGYGLDLDLRMDLGQSGSSGYGSNWTFRTTKEPDGAWVEEGGDFILDYEKNFYFDTGLEDLSVDVTDIIEAQLAEEIPAHGLCVKMSGSYEDGTIQKIFYTKRFSSRSSEFFYKRPVLEVLSDAIIKDNRGNFFFKSPNLSEEDNTQNIYFYNKINGVLKNLPNDPNVHIRILNSSGEDLITPVITENISTGIYKASIQIDGTEDDELYDQWYSGSSVFYTGNISATTRKFEDSYTNPEYVFSITNLKNVYKTNETALIKVFSREKDWSPNIYNVANKTLNSLTFDNLYYKIKRVIDNYVVIDYGINPVAYTRCSYDKNGNYFDLDMSLFEPGYMYEINFMLLKENLIQELPFKFKFKVE